MTLAACAASGCSSGEDENQGKEDPQKAAVLAAYEGYWPALLKASDPPNPESTDLANVAAAPELDRARAVLAARAQANQVVRGSYEHDARVESIAKGEAKLTDCLTVKTSTYSAKTQKVEREDPRGPFPVAVTLKLDGDVWKVADVSGGTRACSPKQTSTPSPQGSLTPSPQGS